MSTVCSSGVVLDETLILVINRLLTDNYTLLILFIVLTVISIVIGAYFFGQLKLVITAYYNNQGKDVAKNPVEDEFYDQDENDPYIVNQHLDDVSGNFYKKVETNYKDYNNKKTAYILNNYTKDESDDIIDRNILFAKNDDYTY